MIHQLSYSDNQSINLGIPSEESLVQYSSVANAITFIQQCGSGAFCCKTDKKSAFRVFNLHHSQFNLGSDGTVIINLTLVCKLDILQDI